MPILLPGRTADETTAEETPLRGFGGIAVDLFLVATLAALVGGVVVLAQRWNAPIRTATPIDLDPRALPGYTLLSLSRGFAAYLLSLVFTLVYGTIAAHSKRAEKVMIPLLDIGQGIPVLGFLPGLVLGMVALFPHSNVGLELACVLMIFTGQVWNMVFSFYGSVRSVPAELREVARIHRFGWFKTFRTVEVSSSAIGLVWNSMMSMAGGWFFLTVNEAFTLGNRDFRLPGVGSYMAVAIAKGDRRAMFWAIVAMSVMILAVDQLLWKPLVAWSERFRLEELSSAEKPRSWVLDLLRRSPLMRRLRRASHAARGVAGTGDGRLASPRCGKSSPTAGRALAFARRCSGCSAPPPWEARPGARCASSICSPPSRGGTGGRWPRPWARPFFAPPQPSPWPLSGRSLPGFSSVDRRSGRAGSSRSSSSSRRFPRP